LVENPISLPKMPTSIGWKIVLTFQYLYLWVLENFCSLDRIFSSDWLKTIAHGQNLQLWLVCAFLLNILNPRDFWSRLKVVAVFFLLEVVTFSESETWKQ
jgi:hypothetical protein